MQGLELCRRYFFEVGLPAIRSRMPEAEARMAAGLAGGSECHGADDDVSRDHGWGPRFTVWLSEDDVEEFAEPLRAATADLPCEYLGYGWAKEPERTCGVIGIASFVEGVVGYASPPAHARGWLHIPEERLFTLATVAVFHDPTGVASSSLAAFARYPEDVRRKRLGACLFWAWEWA